MRNVLAVCVDEAGALDLKRGHTLVIYDARNPSMVSGGKGDRQWRAASEALRVPGLLRRLSWQAFISQWPNDPVLEWLKQELAAKYGLLASRTTQNKHRSSTTMSINPDDQDPQTEERESNELFSIIDGKKTDAHLHEEILAGADPVEVDKLARENARNIGLSEEQILTLFGPPLTGSE